MKYFFLIYLIHQSIQTCQKGCLRCSAENNCLVCDITQNYFLSESSCLLKTIEKCQTYSIIGVCLLCSPSTYLDANTQKCVSLPTEKAITNCLYYDSSFKCVKCAKDFVMQDTQCEAVSTKIQNCFQYSSKTECSECETNYYLSAITKTCSALPSQRTCPIYTEFQCRSCKSTFLYSQDYLNGSLQLNNTQINNLLREIRDNKTMVRNDLEYCIQTSIENCIEYQTPDICQTCRTGYYIQSNKCIQYPSAAIPFCQIYQTASLCLSCQDGYYLSDVSHCQAIPEESKTQNLNCQNFKGNSKQIECFQCKDGFYLSGNGICVVREQEVTKCAEYTKNEDNCLKCEDTHILSNDGLKCVEKIANCKSHTAFSKEQTPTCSECENLYYLDTTCKQGQITNCLIYESDTLCQKCQNKFYLTNEKKCSAHDDIPECKDYSQQTKNICTLCNQQFLSFRIKSRCKLLNEITNCEIYNNQTGDTTSTCQKCKSGFKLTGNSCTEITIQNCIQVNAETGQCSKCKEGFLLATASDPTPNSCKSPYSYVVDNCFENNIAMKTNLNDSDQCTKCKKGSYPILISYNQAICFEDSLISVLDVKNIEVISNCLVYRADKCVKCKENMYLSKDQSQCLTNKCQGSGQTQQIYHLLQLVTEAEKEYLLPNYCNQPEVDSTTNWVLAPSVKNKAQIPIKCKSLLQIINLTLEASIDFSNFNPNVAAAESVISDPLQVYPVVSCPIFQSGDSINGQERNTLPEDISCNYFHVLNDDYVCVSCPFGQTGSPNSVSFLDGCESITGCSTSKRHNMHPFWAQFMSCHQCTTNTKIPVIAWQGVSKSNPQFNGFVKFTLSEENWKTPSGESPVYSQPIFCLDITSKATIKAGLGITVEDSKIDFVQNCAYALLNLAYSNSFDNSGATASPLDETDALICGGCKPGYKGTYIQDFYVTSCQQIDNCEQGGVWFNACSQCSEGFTYRFEEDNIDFTTCVPIPDKLKNCLAFEQTVNALSSVGKCRICQKGYHLNEDGYCEILKSINCDNEQFIVENSVFSNKQNLNALYYYFYNQGIGCQKCKEGFFGYLGSPADSQICLETDFIKENLQFEATSTNNVKTKFVDNCENYKNQIPNFEVETKYYCALCSNLYILRDNQNECLLKQDLQNCLTAENEGLSCKECAQGYGLIQQTLKKCQKEEIENCLQYNSDQAQETVQCKLCDKGFYLEENKCLKAGFPNCEILTSKFTCQKCETNYQPIGPLNEENAITEISYCLKINENLGCEKPKITSTESLPEFECLQCTESRSVIELVPESNNQLSSNALLTQCLSMNLIENCETYSAPQTFSFDNPIYPCQNCSADFFASQSGKICLNRVNKDDNCKEASNNSDQCTECKSGYFLADSQKSCTPNPVGAVGCKEYKEGPVCISCITNRYFKDGQCEIVPEENKVENCLYYESESKCQTCQSQYYLNSGQCEKSTLSNCEVLESLDSCKVCKSGYVFEESDGKNTCKAFTRDNCEELNLSTPYECITCDNEYYPTSQGDCLKVAAESIITNCLKYSSSTLCSVCDEKFALSVDKKKCVDKSVFDINCKEMCALCTRRKTNWWRVLSRQLQCQNYRMFIRRFKGQIEMFYLLI